MYFCSKSVVFWQWHSVAGGGWKPAWIGALRGADRPLPSLYLLITRLPLWITQAGREAVLCTQGTNSRPPARGVETQPQTALRVGSQADRSPRTQRNTGAVRASPTPQGGSQLPVCPKGWQSSRFRFAYMPNGINIPCIPSKQPAKRCIRRFQPLKRGC